MGRQDRLNNYVFVLPKEFERLKNRWEWRKTDNIQFDLFDDNKNKSTRPPSIRALLYESWQVAKLLRFYVKKYHAELVFSNTLISTVPFAPFLIPRYCRLMGVIYRIYLYDGDDRTMLSMCLDKMKFLFISKCNLYKCAFILNDEDSANKLNRIWHSSKFRALPDPFVPILKIGQYDFREKYHIEKEKVLFAHFGAMTDTKSTLEILSSILALSREEAARYCFVFAGVVREEIKPQFYDMMSKAKKVTNVVLVDMYCSYEDFASLCIACDAILTPYKRTSQSSGLIGYASQFHKPVIAVNSGLLGKLVKKYKLGILIEEVNDENLKMAYRKVESGQILLPSSAYCEYNCVEEFQHIVYSYIRKGSE